jgi:hypothetical protein
MPKKEELEVEDTKSVPEDAKSEESKSEEDDEPKPVKKKKKKKPINFITRNIDTQDGKLDGKEGGEAESEWSDVNS